LSPTILVLIGVSVFSRLPFLLDVPLQSDLSMYTYFAYAIARGEVPYKDIVLPHPPIGFIIYSIPALIFDNNLLAMSLFSVSVFSLCIVLCYFIAREFFTSKAHLFAVISALVFALWPGTFAEAFTSPLEVILTFFTLTGFFLYVISRKSRPTRYKFLSGFFFGVSLFVKPTSLFMITTILIFELVLSIKARNVLSYLKRLSPFFAGGLISCVASILWIALVWNALDLFILQAIRFQTSLQDFLTLSERMFYLRWYLIAHIPLLSLSIASLFTDSEDRYNQMLPAIVALVSMVIEVSLVNTYYHHLFYLTPLLAISATRGAQNLYLSLKNFVKGTNRLKPVVLVMLFTLFLSSAWYIDIAAKDPTTVFPWGTLQFFSVSDVTATEKTVGELVASITMPNERIWTSEGAIAFFSRRLIEVPDVEEWPVQVFYDRTWLIYTSLLEKGVQKAGLLKPSQFISAWEKKQTRVLVFIRGKGWIPYPDELLWNGYSGFSGVNGYVTEKYQLVRAILHPTSGYTYEVWLRKS
jgi:hypothetical protein